jgi:hypothetical protein
VRQEQVCRRLLATATAAAAAAAAAAQASEAEAEADATYTGLHNEPMAEEARPLFAAALCGANSTVLALLETSLGSTARSSRGRPIAEVLGDLCARAEAEGDYTVATQWSTTVSVLTRASAAAEKDANASPPPSPAAAATCTLSAAAAAPPPPLSPQVGGADGAWQSAFELYDLALVRAGHLIISSSPHPSPVGTRVPPPPPG